MDIPYFGRKHIGIIGAGITVVPLLAQGANIGSYAAFTLADAIEEAGRFDLRFCEDIERYRATRVPSASRWTNAFLQPPDDARIELLVAKSSEQRLAQEYFENFSRPYRQWERVGSVERIHAWLDEVRIHAPQIAAVTANAPATRWTMIGQISVW
jgi:hypothetical protein